MTMPGVTELIIIAIIIMLLFGAKRLPEIARSFGESISELRKASRDIESMDSDES